ncbi:hypothetical protein BC830DRAFT_1083957 [Chytriomyces sp. MP71]|nr:hypothetical protein BC830DRAFT_1083957 [Chytriomyces sp. MP71]
MSEINIDLGDTAVPILLHEFFYSLQSSRFKQLWHKLKRKERGYSTMDEALDAINGALTLTVLNGKDKESGWDVQKAATAKQQKQEEEHVAKAITKLLNEDHVTVAQNYNNESMN